MSLRHALLGLLAEEQATGYELTQRCQTVLGTWAWHTTHSHVYPEMRKLDEEGLVTVAERASRGRKTYAITEDGRAELRRWLLDPPKEQVVRNETALRMFLMGALDAEDARTLLRAYAAEVEENLAAIQAQIAAAPKDWQDNPLTVGRLAAQRALFILPAVREWTEWSLRELDRGTGS